MITTTVKGTTSMTKPAEAPTLLSSKEAASYLHVPVPTLNRWRANGTGPAYVQLGPRVFKYDLRDLQEFLRAQRHGGPSDTAAAG